MKTNLRKLIATVLVVFAVACFGTLTAFATDDTAATTAATTQTTRRSPPMTTTPASVSA